MNHRPPGVPGRQVMGPASTPGCSTPLSPLLTALQQTPITRNNKRLSKLPLYCFHYRINYIVNFYKRFLFYTFGPLSWFQHRYDKPTSPYPKKLPRSKAHHPLPQISATIDFPPPRTPENCHDRWRRKVGKQRLIRQNFSFNCPDE